MDETESLLELVGDVYDTVLDRSLWPEVLRKASRFVEGASSAVFWNDATSREGKVYFDDGGISPHYTQLYFTKYLQLNPTTTPRFFAAAEEPLSTGDLVPYDEFLRSRFYREWAKPQGLVDFVSITLEKSVTRAALFGVFRHERHGVVDEAARARMRLLTPHIRRAVLISQVVDLRQGEAEMLAESMDGLSAAAILVDGEGRIVHANTAGCTLLAAGDPVRSANGRLAASARKANDGLREILLAAGSGDAALGVRGVALPLAALSGERFVAHVLSLTSGQRRSAGRIHEATAAVFIRKAALEVRAPPVVIAEAFKLTMTELRVLFAIVEVGGVPEVAHMLGVAPSTVKTHLARVYGKTGTARQADLVKLIASFASPLQV